MFTSSIRPAISVFIFLSIVTGVLYPLFITVAAQLTFPHQANGSLIMQDSKVVGASLIGQNFTKPENFWSRASASGPMAYNASASSGANQGPTNPALVEAVKSRIRALQAADPNNKKLIPVDLVTSSASGLDPHISVAAAQYQATRVADARKLALNDVNALITANTEMPLLGFMGEARVNVLRLNLALAAFK